MKAILALFTFLFTFTAFAVDKDKTITLTVNDMHCQSCADKVEDVLKKVDGVSSAKVELAEKKATIVLAPHSNISTEDLIAAVSDAGFSAAEGTTPVKNEMKKQSKSDDGCAADCCDGSHNKKEAKKGKGKKS